MDSNRHHINIQITQQQERKNAQSLKKYLTQALLAFEKNKEWADYSQWLQKVAKYLEEYPSFQIPDKLTFAKRLAQCLNPNLPPITHINTIHVYSLIFRNMELFGYNWCEDLGIFSIGIFPLFQYASFQVKPKILELYKDHYLPLGKQLIPCISGLVVSILPGLDEQNEELQKKVYNTLDGLGEKVGPKFLIGAIWMAILRNPKVRHAGLKFLSKRLTRTYVDADEHDDDKVSDEEDYDVGQERSKPNSLNTNTTKMIGHIKNSPNSANNAAVKQLAQSPADDESIMTTNTEDWNVVNDPAQQNNFQLSEEEDKFFKQLDDELNKQSEIEIMYPNKSSVVINTIMAAMEDENILVQKSCLDFMHSHLKLSGDLFSENEKCILIEACLRLLIRKDQQIQRRVYTWLFGPPDMENKYQISDKNKFALDLIIKSFRRIFSRDPSNSSEASLPLKVLQNFYMEHDHLVEGTLQQLAKPFLSYILRHSRPGTEYADDVHKAGARFMETITSYFSTILTSLSQSLDEEISKGNNQECLEVINLIEFTFKLEASISNKEENLNYLEQTEYLKSIISGILRSTSSISPKQTFAHHQKSSILPFINTALNLSLNLIDKLFTVNKKLYKLIGEKDFSKEELEKIHEPTKTDHNFVKTVDVFSTFFEESVETILHFRQEKDIPQRVMHLFSVSSETLVKSQTFLLEQEITTLPNWIFSVIECIKSSYPAVCIIGVKTLQTILINENKHPIYENMKDLIKAEGARGNKNDDIISLTMEKLWSLLDIHYIQNQVSDILVSFQHLFPYIFADTVSNSFHVPSITEKESAIRRFAAFWKLSNDMAKSDFIDSGVGLFIMLDFLDNDNPLLRHTSKSWLLDSIPFLYRIIDPIYEVLMQVNVNRGALESDHHLHLYCTDSKQYFFTEVYDTKRVQEAFRKLKSILITANELFIKYILNIKLSPRIKQYQSFYQDNKVEIKDLTYLDLLVVLCLRYIQGFAIESLAPQFQIDNASVNASACEFMELLITHVEHKDRSAKMTHFVMEPLLVVLNHTIANADYVLQVQLLNLLKVILFQSTFCKHDQYKYKSVALLSSKWFVPNLLKGLNVDQTYVRVQFINFISLCISILTEYLEKNALTYCVTSILKAYFDIILSKHLETAENNEEFDSWENDMNFDSEDQAHKKIELGQEATIKGEDGKKKSKNTFTIRYQNQNEVYILLEGVKKILDFFLKFKKPQESKNANKMHDKQSVDDGSGFFENVKDIITLGLLKNTEEKKEVVTHQHQDTVKAILGELFRIVFILIYCWRLSKEFRQWAEFTAVGIIPYSFERYNEINKLIKEYHMKIDLQAKNLKSLIISVLRPLMEQYTSETINSFINYWIMECQKNPDLSINPRMMKEIEILVCMNVSPEQFFGALTKNSVIIDISNHYTKKLQTLKKNPYILNYDVVNTESKIFFLVYAYISFCYIDISFLKKDYLSKLWTHALQFTKMFTSSRAPATHLWLLEIYFLLTQKYNPKEILGDNKIRKELHHQVNGVLSTLAQMCAKQVSFHYNDTSQHAQQYTKYRTVLPFPPTVYEIFKHYAKNHGGEVLQQNASQLSANETGHHDLEIILESVKIEKLMFDKYETDSHEHSLSDRHRLFCFKTLRRVGLNLVQNAYSPDKIDKVIKRMKDFMEHIFPIMENKSNENQPFVECASELVYSQLDSSRSFLIKDYKKNILDIFNANDFFKCTKQTLKYWSKIIDWVVTMDKGDLFSELLTKVSAFSFFFNKDAETKQKIKSFERICFIIYSGDRDKYHDKLFIVLEKMGEVIKNAESSHPSLLILILFVVRILILRLSPSTLNDLFRHIWPILLTLMMQIFSKKNTQKNPNLILAALKLIEMMAICQLEEFYINQWVFLFDYFGLTLEPKANLPVHSPFDLDTTTSSDQSQINAKNKVSGFFFQPYITNCIQDNLKINYSTKQVDVQKDFKKVERKIIMTMTNVDDEYEIKAKSLFLCQYLIQQNEFRTQVDPQQIESLIEGDFISLDDYIFKIN